MIYLQIFWEFFKTGLFAVGGGYATIPFLVNISEKYGWFSAADMTSFMAISEITPGPIGVNMATFAGFAAGGLWGGLIATVSLILPALLIILCLCRFIPDFKDKPVTARLLYGLLPVVTAMIGVVLLRIVKTSLLSFETIGGYIWGWALLAVLLVVSFYFKKGPLWLLGIGALWGLAFL